MTNWAIFRIWVLSIIAGGVLGALTVLPELLKGTTDG